MTKNMSSFWESQGYKEVVIPLGAGPSMQKMWSIYIHLIVGATNAHERRELFGEERKLISMCILFL